VLWPRSTPQQNAPSKPPAKGREIIA
jgi:hypothetical protein